MERRWAAIPLAISLATLPCIGLASKSVDDTSAPWTQFRRNARHAALDHQTLRASWRVETGAAFSSSPTVLGQTLYIGNNGGGFYALDVRNGSIRWSTHVKSSLMSNPIIWKNEVIVGEGDQTAYSGNARHPVVVGAGENALVAYDTKSGAEHWRLQLDGSGMPTPAIVDGILVHHDGFGSFIGADPKTGNVRYKRDLASIASMSSVLPVGGDRVVTIGAQTNTIYDLNVRDGSHVWSHAFSADASGVGDCPPATDGKLLFCDYTVSYDDENMHVGSTAVERAYAIDVKTGALKWDAAFEDGALPVGNESAIPLVVQGDVYFGNALAPYLHAVDAATGHKLWSIEVYGPVKDGPVAKDGVLYVGDGGGYLWAIDRFTGRVIGAKNAGVPFNVGSPIIVGQTLVIGSQTGAIIALPLDEIRHAHDADSIPER